MLGTKVLLQLLKKLKKIKKFNQALVLREFSLVLLLLL
jgi:hypothetical protein